MKKENIKKAGIFTGILVCFVAAIMLLSNINISNDVDEQRFQPVYVWTPLGAEGDPGAEESGFLEIIYMNISSTDGTGYGVNDSSTLESWATANMPTTTPNPYANADNYDLQSFQSEQTFVILVRVRYNKTHAWETDKFIDTDCDCQITVTCTSWAVGSNINNASGTAYVSQNSTDDPYIWINWVWDNSGTGYQIADDSVLTNSEIYIEARF
jgi:hypothetical protein